MKEAVKFVRDFKSLAKEADESLAKHKTLELEIERLLRAVVSQDIMSIVQNPSVVDSSNLQTELDRTKERLENCIIKKENEYAKLWNDVQKVHDYRINLYPTSILTPEVIKTFRKKIQVLLQASVIIVRIDNGTEFKNKVLKEYFDSVGISHQSSVVRTPQQNGVVE
ncbi:retrovirus-related pol polyprotein from transposon TNT 1-94 [Tanacetum coccineum]